ncbi:MAG: 16S rRNA (guanine(966)-N(2))-methyltransferase RsmD [Proteobacteria bacterium]|nr:16S rRNA (guanine(966)-N(2))-methyltransferase RsmD [Pseudomonadota bacterium]
MRVVSGKLRGKKLGHFKGFDIRPTTDRVREALFNILATRVDMRGARVLDLFAGTGAVGIEALSRGAKAVTFVDSDSAAIKIMEKNIRACGFEESVTVLRREAVLTVKGLSHRADRFEFIFLDPPYSSSILGTAVSEIAMSGLLAPEGVVVAESAKRAPLVVKGEKAHAGTRIGSLSVDEVRTYGDTLLYLMSSTEEGLDEGAESSEDEGN